MRLPLVEYSNAAKTTGVEVAYWTVGAQYQSALVLASLLLDSESLGLAWADASDLEPSRGVRYKA